MSTGVTVTLGPKDYTVVPQGIGRLRRKLSSVLKFADGEGVSGEIDSELYGVFKTFIPDIAPIYELLGYESQADYESGTEPADEASDRSPTLPQILDAIETVYAVNGADRLVRLGKAVGIDAGLIKNLVNKEMAELSLRRSASSPAPSGDADLESSTTPPPTSPTMSAAPSPSPAFSISSSPESAVSPVS